MIYLNLNNVELPFTDSTINKNCLRIQCNFSKTSTIRIVSLDCREVNDNKLSEMDIINWLHQGDIHFIISHIHQGIINVNMNKLYTSIMKLHYHPGFPAGNNLQCPVFTQKSTCLS